MKAGWKKGMKERHLVPRGDEERTGARERENERACDCLTKTFPSL